MRHPQLAPICCYRPLDMRGDQTQLCGLCSVAGGLREMGHLVQASRKAIYFSPFSLGGWKEHPSRHPPWFLSGPIPCYSKCRLWDIGALIGPGEFIQMLTLSTEDVFNQNCMIMSFSTYALAGDFRLANP